MILTIRKATPEDIARVQEIEDACFPPAEAATYEKYVWRQANYPDYFLVGEVDGTIVSAVNMIPMADKVIHDEIFEMEALPVGDVGAVLSVITHPDYQKQGLAGQMLFAAIAQCTEMGMKTMALTCKEHLLHYYAKFGFEKVGVSASVHGGAVWYDMVRDL